MVKVRFSRFHKNRKVRKRKKIQIGLGGGLISLIPWGLELWSRLETDK